MDPATPHESLPDAGEAAKAFKAKGRRVALAFLANVVLLVVMVGGPYVRGHLRTRALWAAFARASSCVLGGEPASDPGLGLPHGAREHFAQRVLSGDPNWPARCEAPIAALDLPAATFLLPWVKTAELDVSATTKLLTSELSLLARRPEGARVPDRPLRALEKMRAALARHAEAAGVIRLPDDDAVVFDDAAQDVAAARVPLHASADAELWWHGTGEQLLALALDRRGLSYVEVGGGGMVQRRVSRPALLRALVVPERDANWHTGHTLVWAMRAEACDEREDGCTRKAVGVAPLRAPFEGLPEPSWLASHPADRADRSVRRSARRVGVLADTAGGGLQVRVFELAEASAVAGGVVDAGTEAAPLQPVQTWPEVKARGGLLLGVEAGLITHAPATDGVAFLFQSPASEARPLANLAGFSGWVVHCEGSETAGAFGTDERLRMFWGATAGAAPTLSPSVHVPLDQVVHPEEPFRDRVRVVCAEGQAPVLVVRSADDTLAAVRCTADGCQKRALASDVRWFDAVLLEDGLLVAYAGGSDSAQVRTRNLPLTPEQVGPLGASVVPDPCWEGGGGMCGLPRLLRAGNRVLVAAREGTDLRVMESRDAGQHWTPMRGLRKAAAP